MATSDGSSGSESAVDTALWALGDLELELVRVRSEARAARLEARAAEIELEARRLRNSAAAVEPSPRPAVALSEQARSEQARSERSRSEQRTAEEIAVDEPPTAPPFPSGWQALSAAAKQRQASATVSSPAPRIDPPSPNPSAPLWRIEGRHASAIAAEPETTRKPQDAATRKSRLAKAEPTTLAAGTGVPATSEVSPEASTNGSRKSRRSSAEPVRKLSKTENAAKPEPTDNREADAKRATKGKEKREGKGKLAGARPSRRNSRQADRQGRAVERRPVAKPTPSHRSNTVAIPLQLQTNPARLALPTQELSVQDDDSPATERRRRPAAWVMSTVTHILVLLLLAALTLKTPDPQDQLAFSASAPPAASEQLESLVIEPMESADEPSEQTPTEDAAEVDPLADLAAALPASVPPPAASASAETAMISDSIDTSDLLLSSDTEMTTTFCGVAGGGNHFCYVVDSSQSMKNGRFDSARAELLQSIEQLKDDQRFYVIFYDTNVDRMCISDPRQPDDYSANATAENKRALRRWAMQVGLERGAPPDEALEFAFTLRPDVIFLLSDGEFPKRIEDLVAELNRDDSLFGDQGPRSILHTIGYHSRDGEQRMRRLAEANGGQYHYVPKP